MSSSDEIVFNVQLVRKVEKHPILYNYNLSDYGNRELVEAAWNEIAGVMNDEARNCKAKWRNLRAVLGKRKGYYLRDPMSFLRPFTSAPKPGEHNEFEEDDDIDYEIYQMRKAAKRRAIESREFGEPLVSEYVESKRYRNLESEDPRKYFLLSLLPEIQKLTDNQMKFFRRKVLDALDEAEACPAYNRPLTIFSEENTQNGNGGTYFDEFPPKGEC